MNRGPASAARKLATAPLEARPGTTVQTQVTDAHKRNAAMTRLREIPSVDELLAHARLGALAESAGREIVSQATRSVLADVRAKLLNEASAKADPDPGSVMGPITVELLEER